MVGGEEDGRMGGWGGWDRGWGGRRVGGWEGSMRVWLAT